MTKLPKCIGVKRDDEPTVWHAVAAMPGDYDTLCGFSFEVSEFHELVMAKRGQKITCRACWEAWLEARRFKSSDFDGSL